jgi:hypothetical protein
MFEHWRRFRNPLIAIILCTCSVPSLLADFQYQQSSKVTGGAMAGMMKFAGAFSKQAREPMSSTVLVKGNRMAMTSGDHVNIIDLDKETFTDIDTKNRTYAVITFAEMMQAMAKMTEKMKGADGDFTMSADVKNTGASRTINGMDAKQTVLTVKMEGTDKKSGNKMDMLVSTDMWMTPSMPGYNEVRDFYAKMAQKMAWTPNSGIFSALASQQPGMGKGMAEVYKEMSKLDGIPVLQIVRMTPSGAGMPSEAQLAAAQQQGEQAQQQTPQQPAPTVSEAAGQAATGAALGRTRIGGIAGGLGGFGGFGRKKKQQQEEQAPAAQTAPAAQQQPASATPPGVMIELTTELTSFSSGDIEASKFEVPAGFKQVEHNMVKSLR